MQRLLTATSVGVDHVRELQNNTSSMGPEGAGLVLAGLPVTRGATQRGLAAFPAGTHPRILLAAPGLMVAAAFLYMHRFFAFNCRRFCIDLNTPINNACKIKRNRKKEAHSVSTIRSAP